MKMGLQAAAGSDGSWWRRRSLKLRLALWFSLIACTLVLGLLPVANYQIERRLGIDLDHQMGIDWVLIEAHLEADEAGGVRWKKDSPSTLESGGYSESWFDVWSDSTPLMSHTPRGGVPIQTPPCQLQSGEAFYSLVFSGEREARVLQKSAQISGRSVTLRVFRDRSNLQETLRQVLWVFVLGVPVAILLAATGGYFMAGRAMGPIVAMTEQARLITSESLGQRLPNPNPHDELGQLATVFNGTLERLENSFESLRRFTADASHELRTPLTALRSVGEVALREKGDPEALRETIGSMLEEAQRLHDLADTLLMLARVEGGRTPVALERVDLGELVEGVVESIEVLAAEKGQKIEVASPDQALTALADRTLLRQAVMNLLHNAIRYSPGGSTVRILFRSRDGAAEIEVADEGPGIAPEHREKIFERFYRIDKARSRAEGGAGLGLALAKVFVEQSGGTIHLSSEVGQGSRFLIRLPL